MACTHVHLIHLAAQQNEALYPTVQSRHHMECGCRLEIKSGETHFVVLGADAS